jgi:histidine triad (HIT) family protein
MHNHAPAEYNCPICLGIQGVESDETMIRSSDIVHMDDQVMVFVGSFFIGNNPGHLIVVPKQHYENLYDLPDQVGAEIFAAAKFFSLVMREAYGAEGVTLLQNNEPIGDQHAFHYHLHLFPRYPEDQLHQHMTQKRVSTPEERAVFVAKIVSVLSEMAKN